MTSAADYTRGYADGFAHASVDPSGSALYGNGYRAGATDAGANRGPTILTGDAPHEGDVLTYTNGHWDALPPTGGAVPREQAQIGGDWAANNRPIIWSPPGAYGDLSFRLSVADDPVGYADGDTLVFTRESLWSIELYWTARTAGPGSNVNQITGMDISFHHEPVNNPPVGMNIGQDVSWFPPAQTGEIHAIEGIYPITWWFSAGDFLNISEGIYVDNDGGASGGAELYMVRLA